MNPNTWTWVGEPQGPGGLDFAGALDKHVVVSNECSALLRQVDHELDHLDVYYDKVECAWVRLSMVRHLLKSAMPPARPADQAPANQPAAGPDQSDPGHGQSDNQAVADQSSCTTR